MDELLHHVEAMTRSNRPLHPPRSLCIDEVGTIDDWFSSVRRVSTEKRILSSENLYAVGSV